MSPPKAPLGVLLLHGWNSTADTFRHLRPRIGALGLPCRAPTYAGHGGTDGMALRGVRWQAWLGDATTALDDLLAEARRVVVVGHSMGGWLALHLSLDRRADVDAVVIAGASLRTVSLLGPGRPLHFLAPWLPRVLRSVRRRAPSDGADSLRPGYARVPTDSVLELFGLMRATKARLADVDAPLLVLHSRRDTTNAPAGAPRLLAGVATAPGHKRLHWFGLTDHQMFLGPEREAVEAIVLAYLRERLDLVGAIPRS